MDHQSPLIRLAWSARQALRLRGPLAGDKTAQLLNTILVAVLAWAAFDIAVIIPLYAARKAVSTGQALCVVLIFVAALVLLYRGSLLAASLVYLTGFWILATAAIVVSAGIRSPGIIFYVALPISAAWLLGWRSAVLSAGICLTMSLAFALLEQLGRPLPHYVPGKPLGIWVSIVVAMIISALPVAHVLPRLKEALAQSETARQALWESEERFRNMADTAPVMIWVAGPDKLCTFVNKVWLEFTGRTMKQELADGWAEGIHPDDVDSSLASYASAFAARRKFKMEYRLRRRDGEYRWVLDEGVPRFTPIGTFTGYIGCCVDITETKRAQEEAFARQKLESVGQLARSIAHDFNNLLGGILATAEVALSDRTETSRDTEELLTIRTAAIRGGEIVRQLMTFGEEDSPGLQPVDLSLLVEEMLRLLKVSISKNVMLETDVARDLPAVQANPAQIRQVVMNLVLNASEAIGERPGVIRVSTARVSVGSAADLAPGNYLKLEVSDTGSGMTPEVQARIFDPLFTTKPNGHGLGLAAVQGIVRSHFGTISVASVVGRGTRFEILLPCTEQRAQVIPDVPHGASNGYQERVTGTVLVVEDDDTLRLAVSRMVRKKGLTVIEAYDGIAALNLFRAHQREIDVVLLDITLPGMNGLEVLAEMRRIRPSVKIMITTAHGPEIVLPAAGKRQEWAFVRKPYQLNDLWSLISVACREKARTTHAGVER